jgi:hypothetical protein
MALSNPQGFFLDLSRAVLVAHTERIIDQISSRSGRAIDQFCFGSTYLQLNPNYRRLEKMDPLTWKKEGISNAWSGARGLRKTCCKVCCNDKLCGGCKDCLCRQGPVRGHYDGMVILTCITKDSAPRTSPGKMDHEDLAISLEHSLTIHFMQLDTDLGRAVVHTGREKFLQEHNPKLGKAKKHPAYCLYVAYRLDRLGEGTESNATSNTPCSMMEEELEDEDTIEVMEELEEKQLVNRLSLLEQENRSLRELVAKLDHGRSWLEERVGALETTMKSSNFVTNITNGENVVDSLKTAN